MNLITFVERCSASDLHPATIGEPCRGHRREYQEDQVKKISIALALLATISAAQANCFGSPGFQTCTDASGNSYTVNKLGNTTLMNGYNAQTGSNWNQTTQQLGNTTIHNGTAADGSSWNGTTQRLGNTTIHSGTDSRGNSFNKVCNQYGCN